MAQNCCTPGIKPRRTHSETFGLSLQHGNINQYKNDCHPQTIKNETQRYDIKRKSYGSVFSYSTSFSSISTSHCLENRYYTLINSASYDINGPIYKITTHFGKKIVFPLVVPVDFISFERLNSRNQDIERLNSRNQNIERLKSRNQDIKRLKSRNQDIERLTSRNQDIERLNSRNQNIERRNSRNQDIKRLKSRNQNIETRNSRNQDIERRNSRNQDIEKRNSRNQDTERLNSRNQNIEKPNSRNQISIDRRTSSPVLKNRRAIDICPRNSNESQPKFGSCHVCDLNPTTSETKNRKYPILEKRSFLTEQNSFVTHCHCCTYTASTDCFKNSDLSSNNRAPKSEAPKSEDLIESCAPAKEECSKEKKVSIIVESQSPGNNHKIFNQFLKIIKLLILFCKGVFRFLVNLVFTMMYLCLMYSLFLYLCDELEIGSLEHVITSTLHTATAQVNETNIWDIMRPKASDLWGQSMTEFYPGHLNN